MKSEIKSEIGNMKSEIKSEIGNMKSEIKEMKKEKMRIVYAIMGVDAALLALLAMILRVG